MPKVSGVPTGPFMGNRLATDVAAKGVETIGDQQVLNAAVERIGKIKASYDMVLKESNRIGESIHGRADVLKKKGTEDADRLRSILDKTFQDVQQSTSKDMGMKTALIQATSQPGSQGGGGAVESGKGNNISVKA